MRLVSQMSPATPRAAASVEPADMQSAGGVAYAVARACLFVALGCVLGLPNNLPGQWCLYYRFGVFFWLAAIWIASRNARALQHPWRLRIAILVAVGLHTSLWGDYFSAFNRQIAQPFATVLHRADLRGHSLAAMIGDDAFRGQRHALVHLQNYQMVWNDGLAPTMSAEYRFGLLRASAATPMPAYAENVADVAAVPELLDRYAHMDFLLLHGARVVEAVTAATNLTRVAEAGGWVLLRRAAPAIATVTRTDAPAAAAQP